MLNVDLTFVWMALNLLILFLFLRKFLFGRVTKFMDDRTAKIEADMEQGAKDKAEGEAYRQEHESLLKNAETERSRILEAARQKSALQYDEAVTGARAEAARLVAAASDSAQREKEKAMQGMRDEVASLALAAASKVMAANMDTEKNRALVDSMLDDMADGGGVA